MRFVGDLRLICRQTILKREACRQKSPTPDLIHSLNNPTPAHPELLPPGSVENAGESLPQTTLAVRTPASNGASLLSSPLNPP